MKKHSILLLTAGLFLAATMQLPARTWTDAATGRTLEGDYVTSDATHVVVKTGEKPVKIAIARLSEADKAFIKQQSVSSKGQDTVDSLIDELIVQINNLGEAMMSARDKASAEEAAKKFAAISDEIEDISAGLDKLETPNDEELSRYKAKIQNSTKGFDDKFGNFFKTLLTNDEVGDIIGPAFGELQGRLEKLDPWVDRGGKKKEDAEQVPPAPAAEVPATLKKILAEAIDYDDLEYGDDENEDLLCKPGGQAPYTGWAKIVNRKGQVESLEHYKDGKQHGLETMWHENGQKYSETNYKDGKKDGPHARWYENGQKQVESNRKDGEFHGLVTKWRENGNMWFIHNYLDGKAHGLWTEWHENGQKEKETNYKNGERHGLETWWDTEGNIRRQSRFENGREVERIK